MMGVQFVKSVNPGRLNKRLEIWRYVETETDLGGTRTELKRILTVWAEIKPTRGTEFLEYYRDANALQFKVLMRYIEGITEKDVLVYQGRQFEINAILNLMESNTYLEIYCTESKDKVIEEA
jgi:SPP1 family predicted phage head-tail adaptor